VGKIAEKVAVFFDNMALFFSAELTKKALLQTVFLAILPLGGIRSFVDAGFIIKGILT